MTKTKSTKDFDCVQMKRRAAKRIHERLRGKSPQERLDYWRKRTDALRRKQEETDTAT